MVEQRSNGRRYYGRAGGPRRRGEARASAAAGSRSIECLERALAAREPLLAEPGSNVCRLFDGAADGIDGLVIEKLGDVLIAQLHEGCLRLGEVEARELCAHAQRRLGARAVYRKLFARERSAAPAEPNRRHPDPTPWLGEPVEYELGVLENGMRFLVRPYDGYSVGLFLEQRENRQRVRRLAAAGSVLNAFAYTCGFSVAAALGGGATVSVDVSKKHLEWGKRNFAANGIDLVGHLFICSDVFDYYQRAQRQGRHFDLIVLDPPTFARTKRPKRVFVLADDLERLVRGAVELLTPGGHLLLASNQQGMSRGRLTRAVALAAGSRGFEVVERPLLPPDFPRGARYARAIVVRVG